MFKYVREQLKRKSNRPVFIIISVVLFIVFILVIMRIWDALLLRNYTNKQTIRTVSVITAARGPSQEKVVLPGNASLARSPHLCTHQRLR